MILLQSCCFLASQQVSYSTKSFGVCLKAKPIHNLLNSSLFLEFFEYASHPERMQSKGVYLDFPPEKFEFYDWTIFKISN